MTASLPVADLWPGGPSTKVAQRALGSLRKLQIGTEGELTRKTATDLRRLFGFGPKQLAEIRQVLAARGLALAGEVPPPETPAEPDPALVAELAGELTGMRPDCAQAFAEHLVRSGWTKAGAS